MTRERLVSAHCCRCSRARKAAVFPHGGHCLASVARGAHWMVSCSSWCVHFCRLHAAQPGAWWVAIALALVQRVAGAQIDSPCAPFKEPGNRVAGRHRDTTMRYRVQRLTRAMIGVSAFCAIGNFSMGLVHQNSRDERYHRDAGFGHSLPAPRLHAVVYRDDRRRAFNSDLHSGAATILLPLQQAFVLVGSLSGRRGSQWPDNALKCIATDRGMKSENPADLARLSGDS
jgi:hypothetical protein